MDDIMVSYGSDGASVGPHYDNYDVFLLQGEGSKTWRIGQRCDSTTPLLAHDQLRILKTFELEQEFVLMPGDILYVPPGIAHWGIAQGEATTFSIGFRAPRLPDMLSRWIDSALEEMDSDLFFTDAGRPSLDNDGAINPGDIDRAKRQLLHTLEQTTWNDSWFGELVTEPRYAAEPEPAELARQVARLEKPSATLALEPGSRVAWQVVEDGLTLFANGRSATFPGSLLASVKALCRAHTLSPTELKQLQNQPQGSSLIAALLEWGAAYVE
jgi:50S ribosomal protein L16 3-hydroxylase